MQEIAKGIDKRCKEGVAFCKPRARFAVRLVNRSRTKPLGGGAMKGRHQVSAAIAAAAAAFTVAACGGSDSSSDSGDGATKAPATTTAKLSDKPMDLTFLWFEWPPAA